MPVITHRGALQRQQIVLKFLNYYHGKCDGVWGPATIAAKRQFELSGKFNPGYPNNGQPFPVDGPFPSGIIRDPSKRGYITHVDITPEFIKANLSELVTNNQTFDPAPVEDTAPKAEELIVDVSSTVEEPVETEPTDDSTSLVNESQPDTESTTVAEETPVVQQERQRFPQQHGKHNRRF